MKKSNPQQLLGTHISLYQKRKFWLSLFSIILIWSISFYYFFVYNVTHDIYRIFVDLSVTLGTLSTGLFTYPLMGEFFSILIYLFLVLILVFKTFEKEEVKIVYPILLTILYMIGHVMGILQLSSGF